MKRVLKYIIPVIVAVVAIAIIDPILEKRALKEKYDFKVSSIYGELTPKTFENRVYAIYFGYTFCPDVCPTSLSALSLALKDFDEKSLENFRGVFISVDPNRDKIKELDEYAKYFHKNFIGATSTKENLDEITKRFETYYKKVELEGSSMGYSVSHTSYIYIFDKEGNFVKRVEHFANPSSIKEALKPLL